MIDQTFSKRKLTCWAEIGGEEYDIVQISSDFALNTIPTAVITLALGIKADESDSVGSKGRATSVNDKFLFRNTVKVFATSVIQDESPDLLAFDKTVPGFDKKLIFSGYVAGFGFQRTPSSSVLTISAEHWLADLAAATMLSSATHSATPADLQRSALYREPTTVENTSKGGPTLMGSSWIGAATGGESNVCNDLWETGIKSILLAASKSQNLADLHGDANVFGGGEAGCQLEEAKDALNKVAESALNKITSLNAKLSIKLSDASSLNVGKGIFADLSSLYLENLAGQTMWDCLIACSGNYMFAVAPSIDMAQVVPYCPTISTGRAFKTITADQISSINISGDCPRTLRGVALVVPQEGTPLVDASEGASWPGGVPVAKVQLGGAYISPAAKCKGVVLFKHPPGWLCPSHDWFEPSPLPVDTTISPKEPGTNSASKEDNKILSIRDSYAKALFGVEVTKGRQGTISGPLRFDIGVGSFIAFELPEETHSSSYIVVPLMPSASTDRYFYGTVVRVSFVIDSNSATSSTTYTVAHVRTHAEENNKDFVMAEHPIYNTTWIGGDLDAPLPSK